MAEVVLVPGSCHGTWCFDRLIEALRLRQIPARAIDPNPAPGVPAGDPSSLAGQAARILAGLRGPSLLVGHSAAGYPITAAAEADPSRIIGLVYLCAYLPRPGQSLAQMRRAGPGQPLKPALRLAADRSSFTFDPDLAGALFYHDCSPEDRDGAIRRLRPEPVAPQETPLALGTASQGLPRFYIQCSEDRAIPPEFQAEMAATLPPENRYLLATSHSPFLSAPGPLAALIAEIRARLA